METEAPVSLDPKSGGSVVSPNTPGPLTYLFRRLMAAGLLGLFAGVALAAWHVSHRAVPIVERHAPSRAKASASRATRDHPAYENSAELERLRVRNRRLEALVTALREREQHAHARK